MTGERVRASDAEREEYATILRAAMTEGRLTLQEGEERLARAYASRFRDELPPLAADLPDGGRRALRETPEAKAELDRHARRHLSRHAGFVAVVAVLLTGLWVASGAHFFWPAIPLFFMLFGLARHARWRRWARAGGPPWMRHSGHHGAGWGEDRWAAAADHGRRR